MRLTRKVLTTRIKELEAQLAAAGGETRKNLRERVARVTKEVAEGEKVRKQLQEKLEQQDKILRDCYDIIEPIVVTTGGVGFETMKQLFESSLRPYKRASDQVTRT